MTYSILSDKRKQQLKAAVKRRRAKIKRDLIELKGGKCERCGYDKCDAALEFHHLDPTEKDFQLASTSKAWHLIKEEAEKCIMLCANCHREVHNGV